MKKYLAIVMLTLICYSGFTQEIEGPWSGKLEVQAGKTVLFVFQISRTEGKLMTEIAIPSQGVSGLMSQTTTFENHELIIDAANFGFSYSGRWDVSSGKIEGTFREGVNAVPLVLSREVIEEVKPFRPQEPVKPYPYREEEVKFHNAKADVVLAGTLTLPDAPGKMPPVVILISGSGPQDRNESFAGHKPFLVLSDYLTRHGVAVLRYDDRGFGESTGHFAEATTADFAMDVIGAIDFLKGRNDIDVNNIGLIGHSEGAIIAPMVANLSKEVAFIIMLAGTGTAGREVSLRQALDFRNFQVPDEGQYKTYVEKAIDIASSDNEPETVRQQLTTFYQQSDVLSSLLPTDTDKDQFIENLVNTRTTPWIRYFYSYNPVDEIRKIKIPALALYGSNDMQVPPMYHLQPVKDALALSQSAKHDVILLEGLNHLFQHSKTGLVSEYAQIEETFAPQALEIISTWIREQTE